MFTVLIAEKRHIDAIKQENRLFFEPFLNKEKASEYAFCEWKPEGQTLEEAVPGLLDAVSRKKEWRAVIINSADKEQLRKRNPFDAVDYSDIEKLEKPADNPEEKEETANNGAGTRNSNGVLSNEEIEASAEKLKMQWERWLTDWVNYYNKLRPAKESVYRKALELPLQKLATWLCFRPEDYVLEEKIEKKLSIDEWVRKKSDDEEKKAEENKKTVVLINQGRELEDLEDKQYRHDLQKKEMIRREFIAGKQLKISYPSEVLCVSERITDNGYFNPKDYWENKLDSDYSPFVDRNMYFDRMRFMAFDVLEYSHRDYRNDRLRFLYAVMIIVSNPTPMSAMRARKLYVLESENDETPLYQLITSFDKKLASTSEQIGNEIDRIRSEIPGGLSDRDAASIFCARADVSVTLDESCNMDGLFASKNYGYSSNCPSREYDVWEKDYKRSMGTLEYAMKQEGRAVKKSVGKLNLQSEMDLTDASRLNAFQLDDVRCYTENSEDDMVSEIPPSFADISKYTAEMQKSDKEIRKILDRRMSRKTTIILGIICLALFFVCLLPLLLKNIGNVRTSSTATVLISVLLGTVALVMLITLWCLRLPLVSAVKAFNEKMREIRNDIYEALRKYSRYLSSVCNVRRGYAVLNYNNDGTNEYTKGIRIRRKHQEDIRKKRAFLKENYGDYIMDKSYCDSMMAQPYDYDFGHKAEYEYYAPFLAGDARRVEFLVVGNYVEVPSSFVTRLLTRMELVYDKPPKRRNDDGESSDKSEEAE